jgi:hypothetical protein
MIGNRQLDPHQLDEALHKPFRLALRQND